MLYPTKTAGLLALTALLAAGGCASTSEMEQLRTDIAAAQATADQAAADAAAAREEAAQANATANNALGTAEAAKSKAEETESKIDRMFKKAMYK